LSVHENGGARVHNQPRVEIVAAARRRGACQNNKTRSSKLALKRVDDLRDLRRAQWLCFLNQFRDGLAIKQRLTNPCLRFYTDDVR
jgi:hypothetical protein